MKQGKRKYGLYSEIFSNKYYFVEPKKRFMRLFQKRNFMVLFGVLGAIFLISSLSSAIVVKETVIMSPDNTKVKIIPLVLPPALAN